MFDVTTREKVADFSLFTSHFSLLKVLPVFHRAPGATPSEAVLQEKAVQEIALDNLVGEALTAVDILHGRSGLHDATSVLARADIRIIEGIDIDSHARGMLGELGRS